MQDRSRCRALSSVGGTPRRLQQEKSLSQEESKVWGLWTMIKALAAARMPTQSSVAALIVSIQF